MLRRKRPERARPIEEAPSLSMRGTGDGSAKTRQVAILVADGIDSVFEGKLQALPVMIRERADAQLDARQVQPLFRAQFAADGDAA